MERFRMLKAKGKRLREEQESRDGVGDVTLTLSEDMNCSLPQVPHPTKRACAGNVRVLKEEDISAHAPTKVVSKLDPPAVKRSPVRCVDFGAAAELMSNATGGCDQEGQADKKEEIAKRDYRDEGDGSSEEAKDGLQHDDKGHQQSENREAGAIASAVKEEDNEEELNVEEILQPTNNVTGDDGNGSPVLTATTTTSEIPTSAAVEGKKRSREVASSKTEEESAASSVSVPRCASAAGNQEPSSEKKVERHQSDNREAAGLVSARQEKNDNEELNIPFAAGDDKESSAGGDDLVQRTNDGNGSPVMPATSIATSKMTRSKKRSRETSVEIRSPRHLRAQTTRSMKRAKHPHSTLHETSEEADTTAQTPVVRRSMRSATIKAREGTFKGTRGGHPHSTLHETSEVAGTTAQTPVIRRSSRSATIKAREGTFKGTRGGSEVPVEEADDNCMPIHGDDESPLDYADADHDEDGRQGIVAKSARQGSSEIKSFDERFTALIGFKQKFGHCNVQRKKSGEYQSLGKWCSHLRTAYKKIHKRETPDRKLTQENIRQLEVEGFRWSIM